MKSIAVRAVTLFATALLFQPALTLAANESIESLEANCRLEGESGGLEGKDLEEFVKECVTEMSELELNNS